MILLAILAATGCRPIGAPWPPTAATAWWGSRLQPDESVPDVRHFTYSLHNVQIADLDAAAERDMSMGLYVYADATMEWMADAPRGHLGREWWEIGQLWPAHTVSGGRWAPWPKQAMIDVTSPAARARMVQAIQGYLPPSEAEVGLMFDYFTVPRPAYLVGPQAALDLDGDGVGHDDDPDEQALLRKSYAALLDACRAAMPKVRLSANGQLALRDTAFTKHLDGIYVEGAGAFWPSWSGRRGVDAMLAPGNPLNWWGVSRHLRSAWPSVLECKDEGRHEYAVALAMMLTTEEHPVVGVAHDGPRPAPVDHLDGWWAVGRPVSDLREMQPGLYARAFEDGVAHLRITDRGLFPRPFEFVLRTADGDTIAHLE